MTRRLRTGLGLLVLLLLATQTVSGEGTVRGQHLSAASYGFVSNGSFQEDGLGGPGTQSVGVVRSKTSTVAQDPTSDSSASSSEVTLHQTAPRSVQSGHEAARLGEIRVETNAVHRGELLGVGTASLHADSGHAAHENATVDLEAKQLQPEAGAQPPQAEQGAAPSDAQQQEDDEDRHNFALAKDGSKVVAANKEAKKASALLDNDADTFLKNDCKADKWVIVELSQVALVDSLQLSQNELYSSRIEEFEVKGRQSHPRAEGIDYARTLNSSAWQLLGRFNASNAKGTQAFKLDRPTWAKYLQLRVLSHYGTEAVCALNDLGVFGKSAAEDLEARLTLEPDAAGEAEPTLTPPPPPAIAAEAASGSPTAQQTAGNASSPADARAGSAAPELQDAEAKNLTPTAKPEPSTVLTAQPDSDATDKQIPGGEADTAARIGEPPNLGAASSRSPPAADADKGVGQKVQAVPKHEGPRESSTAPAADAGHGDELPINSASSAATRHGGSVYDIMVQELKAIKLAQKAGERTLAQLQKNVTAVMGGFAFELDLLASQLRLADPVHAAILPAGASDHVCAAGSNGSRAAGNGLDFREQQCLGEPTSSPQVIKPPSELEILQLEVAALRGLVLESKRQADAMLVALASSLLGGLGLGLSLRPGGSAEARPRGALLLLAAAPLGLGAWFWLQA